MNSLVFAFCLVALAESDIAQCTAVTNNNCSQYHVTNALLQRVLNVFDEQENRCFAFGKAYANQQKDIELQHLEIEKLYKLVTKYSELGHENKIEFVNLYDLFEQYKLQLANNTADINYLEKLNDGLSKTVQSYMLKQGNIEKVIEHLYEKNEKCFQAVSNQQKKVENISSTFVEVLEQINDLKTSVEKQQAQITYTTALVRKHNESLLQTIDEHDLRISSKVKSLEEHIDKLKVKASKFETQMDTLTNEHGHMKSVDEERGNMVDSLTFNITVLDKHRIELERGLYYLQSEMDGLKIHGDKVNQSVEVLKLKVFDKLGSLGDELEVTSNVMTKQQMDIFHVVGMTTDMNKNIENINEELNETKADVVRLEKNYAAQDVQITKLLTPDVSVYFKAQLSQYARFSAGKTIVFNKVLQNIGRGYDATTGKFTARVSGQYLFSVTIATSEDVNTYIKVVKNTNTELGRFFTGIGLNLEYWSTGSETYVVHLDVKDTVCVIVLKPTAYLRASYSSFMGMRL